MLPMFASLSALALTACVHNLDRTDSADTATEGPPPTLADAAAGAVADGTTLHLDGVVATTRATTNGGTFFVQNAQGEAGLRVDLAYAGAVEWVRPGDTLDLIGVLDTTAGSPVLDVWEPDWINRTGSVDPPEPVPLSLEGPPVEGDAGRLVRLTGLVTASCPDAVGNVQLAQDLLLVDRLGPLEVTADGATIAQADGALVRIDVRWELWAVDISGLSGGTSCP
jgi:hypothetical protein